MSCPLCDPETTTAFDAIPVKDWLVTKLDDRGPATYYRFHVEGENLNHSPECRERKFSWDVRDLCYRYDLSRVAK